MIDDRSLSLSTFPVFCADIHQLIVDSEDESGFLFSLLVDLGWGGGDIQRCESVI